MYLRFAAAIVALAAGAAGLLTVAAKPISYDLPEETAALAPGPGVELAQRRPSQIAPNRPRTGCRTRLDAALGGTFLALATNTHSSNRTSHGGVCGHHPDTNRGQ